MYCFRCGKKIEDGANFCKYCGARVSEEKKQEKAGGADQRLASVARRLQQGDESAFDELYAETQKYVRYMARQTGIDSASVEDVVQEVYISIYQKIHSLEDADAAWGWIKTVTHNTAVNVYRKNSKYVLVSEEESDQIFENVEEKDTLALPEDAMENRETQRMIASMLDELPKMQRQVMIDYYFNEWKVREIAENLEVSEGTVKSYLAKGRRAMEEKLLAYQKKSGVKLRAMPMAPVLYLVIREAIADTAAIASVPSIITAAISGLQGISGGAAEGAAISSAAAETAKTTAGTAVKAAAGETTKAAAGGTAKATAGTAAKTAAIKAAAGISAVAVVGTGAAVYMGSHTDSGSAQKAIEAVTEEFEEACKNMDNEAILDCLSEDSASVLARYDLTSEYRQIEGQDRTLSEAVDFSLTIDDIEVEGSEASAWCVYVQSESEGGRELTGYLGYVEEDGEWKLDLCRENKRIYRDGSYTTDARFPQLIETELIYNDEVEKK